MHRAIYSALAIVLFGLMLINASLANAGQLEDAAKAYKARDFSTALRLWRSPAEQGNAAAQTGLGILYDNGFAVPMDQAQAVVWLRKAAEQNESEAEYRLGEMYVQGSNGLLRDLAQGLTLMRKAADQGNVRSMQALGELYRLGLWGVPKDIVQAAEWQRKGAELGYSISMSRLAVAYEFGQGVPLDIGKANFWFEKAKQQDLNDAERGEVVAELNVARMYESGGQGYSVDKKTALHWYQKAAQQDGPLRPFANDGVARLERDLPAR